MPEHNYVWDTIPIPINGAFVYDTEQLEAVPVGTVITNGGRRSRWFKVDNTDRPWSSRSDPKEFGNRVRSVDFSCYGGNNFTWMWELNEEIQAMLRTQVVEELGRDESWRANGPLSLVSIEDGYSVYIDTAGNEVRLAHGTVYMLVDFAEIDLDSEWDAYREAGGRFPDSFLARLRAKVINPSKVDTVHFCADCTKPVTGRLRRTGGDRMVCATCIEGYTACSDCATLHQAADMTAAEGDKAVCARCVRNYMWCEECNLHYNRRDVDKAKFHRHFDRCCASPQVEFAVPNGGEPLPNDTIVGVTMEDGLISEAGMEAVTQVLVRYAVNLAREQGDPSSYGIPDTEPGRWYQVGYSVNQVGNRFKTKDGAFAKRVGRYAYKQFGLKMPEQLMAKVGTTASDHSRAKAFSVSVTRELNGGPEEYGNAASCWWQSYGQHRCTLKSNGGFGLLTHAHGQVVGRTWVIPLRLQRNGARPPSGPFPTFDAMNADVFMVFNQYGELANHVGPRLLAHMIDRDWTYQAVTYEGSLYVNNDSAYLVGSEDDIKHITRGGVQGLAMDFDQHSNLFATEQRKTKKEKANV